MAGRRSREHFAIEYRPNGTPIDPAYRALGLGLGQVVVGVLQKKLLVSPNDRFLPMLPSTRHRRPLLTLVCEYPGDALVPAKSYWRVPTEPALWEEKAELAAACFGAVHRLLRGTQLASKRRIFSGSTPAGMRAFKEAFADPIIPELTESSIPVDALAVVDRTMDMANAVFRIASGSEAVPSLHCIVESFSAAGNS